MSVIQDEVFVISELYKIAATDQQAGNSNKHQRKNSTHIWKTKKFRGREIIREAINH